MNTKSWWKIRCIAILKGEIIYNKVEQGLSYILGDFVIAKHARV